MCINGAAMVILYLNRTPTLQPGPSSPRRSMLEQFLVMGVTKLQLLLQMLHCMSFFIAILFPFLTIK